MKTNFKKKPTKLIGFLDPQRKSESAMCSTSRIDQELCFGDSDLESAFTFSQTSGRAGLLKDAAAALTLLS